VVVAHARVRAVQVFQVRATQVQPQRLFCQVVAVVVRAVQVQARQAAQQALTITQGRALVIRAAVVALIQVRQERTQAQAATVQQQAQQQPLIVAVAVVAVAAAAVVQ
jgi:hypothetical protein